MLREAKFHCVVWEVGVKPDDVEALLRETRKRAPGVIVQVFSADREPSLTAVEMIAAQTLTAAASGSTLAERPELDLLLRLAGTRQIEEAFKRAGYKAKGRRLFMVAAEGGKGDASRRLRKALASDKRFAEIPRDEPPTAGMELVEGAALLSAGL